MKLEPDLVTRVEIRQGDRKAVMLRAPGVIDFAILLYRPLPGTPDDMGESINFMYSEISAMQPFAVVPCL